MGFTTPGDVNNIVLANIGGIPQIPATTTLVEGKVVTPQINSVCSLGDAIDNLSSQISAALTDLLSGVNTLLLNPLKDLASQVLSAIQTILSAINVLLTALSSAVQAAVNLIVAEIALGVAQIQAIVAYVDNMLGQGLNQILGALSMCSPSQKIPAAKTYGQADLTSSLNQQQVITNFQLQCSSIQSILIDTTTTDDQKIALLNSVQSNLQGSRSTLTTAMNNDSANLASAQLQNQSLSKMTQIAHGLNNPTTAPFLNSVLHPANASMLQGLSKLV